MVLIPVLRMSRQTDLCEFKASQGYVAKLCQKKKKKKKRKKDKRKREKEREKEKKRKSQENSVELVP